MMDHRHERYPKYGLPAIHSRSVDGEGNIEFDDGGPWLQDTVWRTDTAQAGNNGDSRRHTTFELDWSTMHLTTWPEAHRGEESCEPEYDWNDYKRSGE